MMKYQRKLEKIVEHVDLFALRYNLSELSFRFDISVSTLRRYFRANGINYSKRRKAARRRYVKKHILTKSAKEIADDLMMNEFTIYNDMRQMEMGFNRRGGDRRSDGYRYKIYG